MFSFNSPDLLALLSLAVASLNYIIFDIFFNPPIFRSGAIYLCYCCERFRALMTAFTAASSIFVSVAAPKNVVPEGIWIWI